MRLPLSLSHAFAFLCLLVMAGATPVRSESNPDAERVEAIGKPIADALISELQTALRAALAEGDLVQALATCATRAPALSKELQSRFGKAVRVQRVTERPRNPANRADRIDSGVLSRFSASSPRPDGLPLTQVILPPGEKVGRYYREIRIAPLCLSCHGDPRAMPTSLREVIRLRYPEDSALGYREGDLRGAVRVMVPLDISDLRHIP